MDCCLIVFEMTSTTANRIDNRPRERKRDEKQLAPLKNILIPFWGRFENKFRKTF